jgi:tetratricopeptide (TPR) repeat protein
MHEREHERDGAQSARPSAFAATLQQWLASRHRGEFEKANALYGAMLSQSTPPDFDLAHQAGIAEALRKDPATALQLFALAVTIDPRSALVHCHTGNALYELGRNEEALASYDRAVSLDAAYAPACSNRGVVLQDLKRYEEAIASYDRALLADPRYVPAL